MTKEMLMGIGTCGIIMAAAVIAVARYMMAHKDDRNIERIFVDELNMGEVKKWFMDKITSDSLKGCIFYPTKENSEKWKIKTPEQKNMLVQAVYNEDKDEIVAYREITFSEMSPKLNELLETGEGIVVIEK